jgi:epoxyqueuosine reductase
MSRLISQIDFEDFEARLILAGASLIGYAELSALPEAKAFDLRYGISIAAALNPTIVSLIGRGPVREYHAEYIRLNKLLASLEEYAACFLSDLGFRALAIAPTGEKFDRATLRTNLPHKSVATLAGLGWIGKCALLVTRRYGSAVRLGTVLTDAELPCGTPVNSSQCGDCDACVIRCPGRAVSGKNWQSGASRESFYDAFSCCRTARELSKKAGFDATICGICIAVCPWTKRFLSKCIQSPQPNSAIP